MEKMVSFDFLRMDLSHSDNTDVIDPERTRYIGTVDVNAAPH